MAADSPQIRSMPQSLKPHHHLVQAGTAALRRGDAAVARQAFERLVATGAADAEALLGLAYACVALNDSAAALRAVEELLVLEPQSLLGLSQKADLLLAAGDSSGALGFYRAAVRAVPDGAALPPALLAERERAATMQQRLIDQLAADLRRSIGAPSSSRFAQALDILFGQRQIFPSQPRHFYLPELPTIQFHDRRSFAWLDAVEAATDDIRAEMLALIDDEAALSPYVQSDPRRPPPRGDGLADNPAWSACYLWKNGRTVAEHAARCPRTMAVLAGTPMTQMPGRSPSALFSVLRPGAHIPPHHGFVNSRLIVHLPLVVPKGCALRVGNETREWVEGSAWAFDDTIEHEAWNRSDHTRVILLFEVWRPELSMAEREQVRAMFEAIDRSSGTPSDWSI